MLFVCMCLFLCVSEVCLEIFESFLLNLTELDWLSSKIPRFFYLFLSSVHHSVVQSVFFIWVLEIELRFSNLVISTLPSEPSPQHCNMLLTTSIIIIISVFTARNKCKCVFKLIFESCSHIWKVIGMPH